MRTRRPLGWRLGMAALALALVASACGDDDDDSGSAAPATTAVTSGTTASSAATGTTTASSAAASATTAAQPACTATVAGTQVNYGLYIWPVAIDPANTLGSYYGGTEGTAFYDLLMRYDFPSDKYVPQLAESLTPNADFTVWTLKLRPNMKYSNGDPFDVDNLFTHLDRFADPTARSSARSVLSTIASKAKVDATTATFTLKKAWAGFPYVFSREPGMVENTKVLGADIKAFGQKPPPEAGMGPYTIDHWTPNEELVMKARSDYWGGPVCIQTLRFVQVPGGAASYNAYKAGSLDVTFTNEAPVLRQAKADKQATMTDLIDASPHWVFNFKAGSRMLNLKVRQAFAYAFDEKALNQRAYDGARLETRAFIHTSSKWYSPAIKSMPGPDPEKAKQLLAEAKAEGFDGKIEIQSGSQPPFQDVLIATKAMLDAVGFETTTVPKAPSEATVPMLTGAYEVGIWGYSIGTIEGPVSVLQLRSDNASNNAKYNNPAMDAAIDELLAAPTREAGRAAMAKVNNILIDDVVAIPFGSTEIGLILNDKVKGVKQTQQNIYLWDDAYIG